MTMQHITEYIAESDEDYFAAHLANGWVRIGIAGAPCFVINVPPEHPMFDEIVGATPETVEDIFDRVYEGS